MKALILLLIVSNALSLLSVNGIVAASEIDTVIDIDTEAIIIEAARAEIDVTKTRTKRDMRSGRKKGISAVTTWSDTTGEGGPCVTSRAAFGLCKAFTSCYPYVKNMPDLSTFDALASGQYDTCRYFTRDGHQAFGVCCDRASKPADTINIAMSSAATVQWPPPLPTHPPHHTAPTHPVQSGSWPSYQPVYKPTITTTKAPAYPWPPAVTYPRPISQITTKPPTSRPPPSTQSDFGEYCGAKNKAYDEDQERIVGGTTAPQNAWPWIAVLFNNGRQFCGGSLIDHSHILTAAHCVAHFSAWDVARLTVQLGDHNIRVTNEVEHVERKVKRVVRHRGFDMRTLYSDIAILTLDAPVEYTQNVRPICLPQNDQSKSFSGQTATVIGWGSIRENGPQPAVLQQVSIPIWDNSLCRTKYGSAAPGGITESMICAGQAEKDSCSGDSGGPLMVYQGHWTQVGVVSWGIGCGKGQYPGVYTRVTSYIPWIVKNIQAGK